MNHQEFIDNLVQQRNNGIQLSAYELAALLESGVLKWYQLPENERQFLEDNSEMTYYVRNWKEAHKPSETESVANFVKILRGYIQDQFVNSQPIGQKIGLEKSEALTDELFKITFGVYPQYFALQLYSLVQE